MNPFREWFALICHIITGPSPRETTPASLWRSRSLPQRNMLSLWKSGDGDRSSTKPENPTKKVEIVNASGSSCTAREATTRNTFGPSPADFTSQVAPQCDGPIGAESRPISENQTETLSTVMKVDNHTESANGRSTKQESEDYWAFKPTALGTELRKKLKEEEEQKEREKAAENERKKKRTRGMNKALAAFMKTTDAKNQTKEWGERSLRSEEACPFCNRCS